MNVNFNPNTYDSSASIGGFGDGENPEGREFYISFERTNYYMPIQTVPPTYEIQYGSGWNPKEGEVRGTFNGEGYGRIASYIDDTNTMTALEFDGSQLWGINDFGIIGIKNGNISNVTFGNWTAERTVKSYSQDGTSSTSVETVSDLRFALTPLLGVAMSNIAPRCDGSIESNIPIFLTRAQAEEYLRVGDTTGQINGDAPVEPNDYDYYMYNRISTTVGAGWDYQYLYRYKMTTGKRLALYMHTVAGYPQYDRTLIGTDGIAQIFKGDTYGADYFPEVASTDLNFLGEKRTMTSGTSYTPVMYETNIPTFDTYAHALAYVQNGDETGIVDKWRIDDVQPGEIGDPTDTTPQGENGMVLTYGGRMYRMSNLQLFYFYNEIFDGQSSTIEAILEGLQLFGSNQINALQGVTYYPFDLDDVATISSGSDIYIGAYKVTSTTGDAIQKNDKLINMGSVPFPAPYGARDFRNYEPFCKLYVMLPYAGTHELQISKYIGKNVGLKMAVDLATGCGTYFLYAGNTIMDSFDCVIGTHRPITAVDHAQHVSASENAIMQTVGAVGSALTAGVSMSLAGVAGGAAQAVTKGYQAMNIINDPPMTCRGSFTSGVGLFDVKSPYFIFAQLKPQTPANLQSVMGRPSSAGGLVSSFSGYLSTCAFTLADGFTGTQEEAEEIYRLMSGGIYVD